MGDKVKVRVAVAVDHEGDWNACGWSGGSGKPPGAPPNPNPATDADMAEAAREHVREGECVYFITAELPVPRREESSAVAATVEPASRRPRNMAEARALIRELDAELDRARHTQKRPEPDEVAAGVEVGDG